MQPGGWIGLCLLLLLGGMALMAPRLALQSPLVVEPGAAFTPPGPEHWMGTDNFGRDVWSRFLYGGRISLMVGVIAMAISATTGTLLGVVAGYYGGKVDSLLSWITEVLQAFPGILLALVIIAILGSGIFNVMVAVGIASIPSFMRLSRGQVLRVKEFGYIEAARSLGASDARVLFRHILPNILRPLLVLVTLGMGGAILEGASLSFLGLGAQPPDPEWGAMLSAGRAFLSRGWWIAVFPGLGIFLAVLGINLFGDAIGDLLDPRSQNQNNR
ncbi:MAG TPA: ABC transporter permease [Chloroflexi bacterium]|nr:ABC transporter permease [Chloroflexota bacterium]